MWSAFLLRFNSGFTQNHHILELPDSKTSYHTFGEGKPLLLINGGPGMNRKDLYL